MLRRCERSGRPCKFRRSATASATLLQTHFRRNTRSDLRCQIGTADPQTRLTSANARGQILLRPYNEYLSEYIETVKQLREQFPLPIGIIASEAQQKNFINLMGKILRLRNILTAYDDFETDDIMSPRELEDYRSIYLDLYQDIRTKLGGEKESIVDDLEFEIELVKQVDINVDYILVLVERHRGENEDGDREIPVEISRALAASPSLRGKRDLIEEFYRRVSAHGDVTREFAFEVYLEACLKVYA